MFHTCTHIQYHCSQKTQKVESDLLNLSSPMEIFLPMRRELQNLITLSYLSRGDSYESINQFEFCIHVSNHVNISKRLLNHLCHCLQNSMPNCYCGFTRCHIQQILGPIFHKSSASMNQVIGIKIIINQSIKEGTKLCY